MTTLTGAPVLSASSHSLLALGLVFAASSGISGTAPAYAWTSTPTRVEVVSVAPAFLGGAPFSAAVETTHGTASAAERIAQLRAISGLTTDQIGRLLGVSRRSVHNWISGNAIASAHEERLSRLLALIQALPAATPQERRSVLLDSSKGTSLFHQFMAERRDDAVTGVQALTPRERIAL